MTRNNYREIQVALRKPHTLHIPYASIDVNNLSEAELINVVYHSCQEFNEYYGSPYNTCMEFLNQVITPPLCEFFENSDEDDTLPF